MKTFFTLSFCHKNCLTKTVKKTFKSCTLTGPAKAKRMKA